MSALSSLKPLFLRCSLLTGLVVILPFVNSWHWRLDLGSHFQLQVVLFQIFILLACLIFKYRKEAVVSLIILLMGLFHLSPFIAWPGKEEVSSHQNALSVTSLNVLYSNPGFERITTYLKEQDSDVIFLSEVTKACYAEIRPLLSSYPHVIKEIREDTFGVLLMSRHPIREGQIISEGEYGKPILHAVIDYKGTPITILGLHPIPPTSSNSAPENHEYLSKARDLCLSAKTPLIVTGDLNATPWSANYNLLVKPSGLKSCAVGENTFTTWNKYKDSRIPLTGLMLDHILYSPEFRKHDFSVTSGLGSDHDGLSATLSLEIE